jgi:hypothetical protein
MEASAVGGAGGVKMSPLRRRMIQDMELAGLTAGTHKVYIRAVLDLVKHYGGKRPEEMSEDEVYRYLLGLREELGVARGTFQTRFGGLKFLFYRTLDRNWSLLFKRGCGCLCRSACRGRCLGRSVAA